MKDYKKEFIEFMIKSGVLVFGDFTTKSGRKTPYFINTGNYKTGLQIATLAKFYSEVIAEHFTYISGERSTKSGNDGASDERIGFNVIFGPSYKGIPLAVSIAYTLADKYGWDVPFCFNRKEIKDHGEGGLLIGYQPKKGDRILIVEDVTTSGKSIRETVPILKRIADVSAVGLVVSVNRMERGLSELGALKELENEYGLKAFSIVTVNDIIQYLYNNPIEGKILIDDELKKQIENYLRKYGSNEILNLIE